MKELLTCAMDIGEQMLICGAEVHRVEDSVQRICHALGAKRIDIFIITSSMVATFYADDMQGYSQTRRLVGSVGTDMERLHRLNALSRRICAGGMTLEEIRAEYNAILTCKTYPFWLECAACAVIAGAFTLFFGGGLAEAAVSLVIGVLSKLMLALVEKTVKNKVFSKFVCSFLVSILAYASVKCGLSPAIDKIIIGNIMSLIPGIGFTNALRDLFTGDNVAGVVRSIEAVLMALAIGAGYFLFVCVTGGA